MQHVTYLTSANMSAIRHAADKDGYELLTLDEIDKVKNGEIPENLFAYINPDIKDYFGVSVLYSICSSEFYEDVKSAVKGELRPFKVTGVGLMYGVTSNVTCISVQIPSAKHNTKNNTRNLCFKDLIFVKPIKKETKMQEYRHQHASVYEALAQHEKVEVRFWNSSTNSQDGLCTNIYLNPRDSYAVFTPFIRKTCQFVWIDSDGDYYISGRNNMEFALTFSTKPGFRIIEESIKEEKAFDYTKPLLISLGVGK